MATQHNQHLELAGEALAEAARSAVEARGEKWTDLRASVFEALASLGAPSSAYDVTDQVSRTLGRRIAANSVYRILDVLVAANVTQRIESANAYVVNVHPGCQHDCVFLICDVCGRFDHLDDDRMGASMRKAARSTGFEPVRPILEVRGRCSACSGSAAPR